MTDRELLELAAKACGIMNYYEYDDSFGLVKHVVHGVPHCGLDYSDCWNPLSDDGQALRLAVRCNLGVSILPVEERIVSVTIFKDPTLTIREKAADGDIFTATRRAIVRAAAVMGRNIQKGGNIEVNNG